MKSCEKTDVCAIEDIVEDVYDTAPWHLKEQLTELKSHIKKYPKMYPKTAGRIK
jgi:2-oxoisovalerate dehydrogenase E1 component alpha subunit